VSSRPPPPGFPVSATPIEPGRSPRGCARGALIGCGSAAILVLILFAVFLAYVRRKPEALTDLMMGQIERTLSTDITAEERGRLRSSYQGFRKRLQERRVDREAIARMRTIISSAPGATVSREQVRDLTELFERESAAAGEAPAPLVSPALAPTP
jgi:hypothetical protein